MNFIIAISVLTLSIYASSFHRNLDFAWSTDKEKRHALTGEQALAEMNNNNNYFPDEMIEYKPDSFFA